MSLSLILRSASRIQGYPYMLKCSSIAFNNNSSSFLFLSNRATANVAKSITPTSKGQILTTPSIRSMSGNDHRMMWTLERLFSLALVGLVPAAIIMPNPILDNVAAVAVSLHLHWGIEAMVQDYVRPIIFGNVIPKVSLLAVYMISAITLGGLLYFNYNDVGIGKIIRKLWAIKSS